jgi:DNA (cytosine-5)-methyltransferase 1
MMKIRFISLFTGIGGFDLGLERAGMKCVCQVENDTYCQKVLAKHWTDVQRFGDIRNVGHGRKHELPEAELICGGFPCQPHSIAGKRRGAQDDRDLWHEYRRIVDEYRPNWVIGENVVGIRTTILDQALSDLEDIGYSTGTFNIPACGFNAPHRRERIFILGNTASKGLEDGFKQTVGASEESERIMQPERPDWWEVEPGVGRVVDGFSGRVDRLRILGNAVVPQVVEFIGRGIIEVEYLRSVNE